MTEATPKLLLDAVYEWEANTPDRVYMTQPLGNGECVDYTWGETLQEARRMAAHWETVPVVRQLLHPTRAHFRAGVGQTSHLVRTLGVRPSAKFFGAARSVGQRGKRVLLERLADQGITEVSKVIASGRWVTASITRDSGPAVVMAEFARGSLDLSDLRIYAQLA